MRQFQFILDDNILNFIDVYVTHDLTNCKSFRGRHLLALLGENCVDFERAFPSPTPLITPFLLSSSRVEKTTFIITDDCFLFAFLVSQF